MNFDFAGYDIVRFTPPFLFWSVIFFLSLAIVFIVLHTVHNRSFRKFYSINECDSYTDADKKLAQGREDGKKTGVFFDRKTDNSVFVPGAFFSFAAAFVLAFVSFNIFSENLETYNDNLIYETIQETYDVELTHADVDKLTTGDDGTWIGNQQDDGVTWVEYGSTKIVSATKQITEVTLVRVKGVYKLISIIDEENETFEEIARK